MVYSIKGFLKIGKYSETKTSIMEFSLPDASKHVMLNIFVETQIESYKSSTALCSMNLYQWTYAIPSNILSILNRKEIGL